MRPRPRQPLTFAHGFPRRGLDSGHAFDRPQHAPTPPCPPVEIADLQAARSPAAFPVFRGEAGCVMGTAGDEFALDFSAPREGEIRYDTGLFVWSKGGGLWWFARGSGVAVDGILGG